MTLVKIIKALKENYELTLVDLEKASHGNKAAAQRVRTMSIEGAKLAKEYRKSSIIEEKSRKKEPKKKKK